MTYNVFDGTLKLAQLIRLCNERKVSFYPLIVTKGWLRVGQRRCDGVNDG